MKAELTCAIVRDLLPAYAEGLTCSETNEAVEAHLAVCPACAAQYAAMTAREDTAAQEEAREVDYLKKVRFRTRRRVALAVICTVLVLAAALGVKSFVIGTAAREDLVAVERVYVDEDSTLHLELSCLAPGMTFRGWETTREDGVVMLAARQVRTLPLSDGKTELSVPLTGDTREVRICGRLIWQDGQLFTGPEAGIVEMYEARTPYVGNPSALGKLAEALGLREYFPECTFSLQTTREDYRWTVELTNPAAYADDIMSFYAPLMLALVDNLGEVAWTYPDGEGVLHTHVVTLAEANALLPALTEYHNRIYGTEWEVLESVKEYADSAVTLRQLNQLSWLLTDWDTPVWSGQCCGEP